MANLRRRSARLSKSNTNQSSARKTPVSKTQLESLTERDETPDTIQQSIDGVLATPTTSRAVDRLSQLSALKTPQTEPKPAQAEMDPKTAHRSTTKAPDSGLKLGFSDISIDKKNDTPSKSASRPNIHTSSGFEFKFSADSHLSRNAQKLMENVREDAAKIKAQMIAEKIAQEQADKQTEKMFGVGRKIAQPRGKAGRFSEVHMAQFKKMDSIENHASSFRARPGFAAPTSQSLKRSPSKAELDGSERPKTAGKSTTVQPRRITPPVIGRPTSVSPFKSIPVPVSKTTQGPAKRARQSESQDVSDSRPVGVTSGSRPSTLYSPTKSSAARTSRDVTSPVKPSMIPRSNSTRSTRNTVTQPSANIKSAVKSPESKPLPPVPQDPPQSLYPSLTPSPSKSLVAAGQEHNFTSKLPTLSGIKSILRGNRKSTAVSERPGTPKRPNTATQESVSPKKVDFTPSVKSRHAVKLAIDSPSPAKIRRDTPYKTTGPVIPYDASAYLIQEDDDQGWEDEDSEVTYPALPPIEVSDHVARDFQVKAKEHNRRESKEFKSIFTNLHPSRVNEPATLTSVNTKVNKTNPETHVNKVMKSPSSLSMLSSPSTVRRGRSSGATQLVQPFEDKIEVVPHGLPGKKRRHESLHANDKHGMDDDAKENRRISEMPAIPGAWNEVDDTEMEGLSRAGKRVRTATTVEAPAGKSPVKKPSAAREAAAKNAKERKGKGVLSLSRLNMLSRPKSRG